MYGHPQIPPLPPALAPPATRSARARLRRALRSRKALSGLTQWVIDWGVPQVLVLGTGYVLVAVHRLGWSKTYNAATMMTPPDGRSAWPVSLVGWLLVPAIIGGLAGHVIATRITSVKAVSTTALFRRRTLADRLRPPRLITDLGAGFPTPDGQFLDAFVRLAHHNDWRTAQDHWEIVVRDVMCTAEFADLDRTDSLRLAESLSRAQLWLGALAGTCVVCRRRP
ncbi:DUF6313 family protein [Kitasatospora sp. NPDC002040]|uniref:DUF6313 family protein n=1 Tax=Kitasatospora sp. NPDC002040 TaxID=3154661 RepID=UPI003326C9A7